MQTARFLTIAPLPVSSCLSFFFFFVLRSKILFKTNFSVVTKNTFKNLLLTYKIKHKIPIEIEFKKYPLLNSVIVIK